MYSVKQEVKIVHIQTANSLNFDVAGNSTTRGAHMIIWNPHGDLNQRFQIEPTHDGYTMIKCLHSGLYWDIHSASKKKGTQLIQWDKNGGENQQFKFEHVKDSFYRIQCRHSQLYLDIWGGNLKQGIEVKQHPFHGGQNQLFKIVDVNVQNVQEQTLKPPSVEIQQIKDVPIIEKKVAFVHTITNLSVVASQENDQINIVESNEDENQKYQIETLEDGYCFVQCISNGKYWDIQNSSKDNGTVLIQNKKTGQENQQFKFELVNGMYKIHCRHSGKYLEILGGSIEKGNQLSQNVYKGRPYQLFKLIL